MSRSELPFESAVATGKGDDGTTGLLFGGDRIRKDDLRTEAYGTVDEVVAALGLARADLGVNPDDPETLSFLAWSLTMTGAIDEGLRYANRALEINAADPYSYYYVGLIHLQNGEPDAAIRALESALDNGYKVKMLAAEPYVQPLKADPRFRDLLSNYGSGGEER